MNRAFNNTVALVALACIACAEEPEVPGFSVAAPDELAGATLYLDGEPLGELVDFEERMGFMGRLMRKIHGDDLSVFHIAVLSIDLSDEELATGEHALRLVDDGRVVAEGSFTYPFSGSKFQYFWVTENKIELEPDLSDAQPGTAPETPAN